MHTSTPKLIEPFVYTDRQPEPDSIPRAKELLALISDDIQRIQDQLGDPHYDDPDWRVRARSARRVKLRYQRELKRWLAERIHRQRSKSMSLIVGLYQIARDIEDPEPEEEKVIADARAFIEKHDPEHELG